jgi:hypothetical protein
LKANVFALEAKECPKRVDQKNHFVNEVRR